MTARVCVHLGPHPATALCRGHPSLFVADYEVPGARQQQRLLLGKPFATTGLTQNEYMHVCVSVSLFFFFK